MINYDKMAEFNYLLVRLEEDPSQETAQRSTPVVDDRRSKISLYATATILSTRKHDVLPSVVVQIH